MKHTDEHLKEIFSKRLGEYESNVSPELWSNIASQLPQATAVTSGSAVVTKAVSAKLVWMAAAVAITIASAVAYVTLNDREEEESKPTNTVQQQPPAVKEQAVLDQQIADEPNVTTTQPIKKVQDQTPVSIKVKEEGKELNESITTNIESILNAEKPQTVEKRPSENVIEPTIGNFVQPSPARNLDELSKTEEITAQFTTAPVNKEDLRYFFMPQSANAVSYHWDFGDGKTSNEISPMHVYEDEGVKEIKLTALGSDGAQKVFTSKLSVFKPAMIEAPNIFSPNGDGQNDYFDVIEKSRNVEIQKIVVFNQSGTVFESNGEILWDGNTPQGVPMPSGDYRYYVAGIDKEGNKIEKQGFVTISR